MDETFSKHMWGLIERMLEDPDTHPDYKRFDTAKTILEAADAYRINGKLPTFEETLAALTVGV